MPSSGSLLLARAWGTEPVLCAATCTFAVDQQATSIGKPSWELLCAANRLLTF